MSATLWRWAVRSRLLLVSAMRTLGSLYERIMAERPHWIVIVRTHAHTAEVFYYAYQPIEIEAAVARALPNGLDATLEDSLDLQEGGSTPLTTGRRIPALGRSGPGPAERLIDRDAAGNIVAIAEPIPPLIVVPAAPPVAPRTRRGGVKIEIPDGVIITDITGTGCAIGAGAHAAVIADSTVESSLSAEAPAEVQVMQDQLIEFRIELASAAQPLARKVLAKTLVNRPIVVSLSLQNDSLRLGGPSEHRVPPPTVGQPRYGHFQIHGHRPGTVRAAVSFRQGDSELGAIILAIEVVAGAASSVVATGITAIARSDPRDDQTLLLEIQMRTEGRKHFYEFRLRNEALGLPFEVLTSPPLLDRGEKPAQALFDYVERIYERTTRELSGSADLIELQRQMRALGARLSDELFQPDVVARLWPLRARIGVIRLVSWEPFIPWELVRMREPISGDIDDRFLAEYGLVRTMTGDTPPLKLALRDWTWLGAQFPMGTHEDCGDSDYFTDTLPSARGIRPTRVGPGGPDLLDTLSQGAFDVLHVACHAESPQKKMDSAWLVLGDKAKPGTSDPVLIRVDTDGVKAEATQLRKRRPLVFLNACESGRVGPNLTAWGGWPEVFVRAGAGVFVGTAWAVRNKPAGLFSQAFYDALLDGKMLYEAASAARTAARAAGDASWLAFKVYGHPFAVKG